MRQDTPGNVFYFSYSEKINKYIELENILSCNETIIKNIIK